jgi:hypothetical protein
MAENQDSPTNPMPASKPAPKPADSRSPEATLKLVHGDGKWAVILGVLVLIIAPLASAALYDPAQSEGITQQASIIVAAIFGLIQGGLYIWFGLKLKKTTIDTLQESGKTLRNLMITLIIFMVLSIFLSGRGIGILNLILLIDVSRARRAIKKLYPTTA